MASDAPNVDFVDPLSGIYGPMLFPRTIRASADVPVPADAKDLESIHSFMKSLDLRSPEKLMKEAKRIVDGGAELLESNFARFNENVGFTDAIAGKGEGRPQDRRPGLGRARKRAPFSLRTNISQPAVSTGPTLNIDSLQDPDEFFNAYERMENANKEIEKLMGGNVDNIKKNYRPSKARCRGRREGILGNSYNYKRRYSSEPSENDTLTLSSVMVDQGITVAPEDESRKKLVQPEPIPDADFEEVELAASMKKTENEVSGILEELLSCNNEDLEGDRALNLLQERLKIKPLDLENLCPTELPGVRRMSTLTVTERDLGNTSIPSSTESLQKRHKSSPAIGSVLKILSQKSMVRDQLVNPQNSASPTPRSPFASISSLQKRILQPYPLRDPFSPANVDGSACQNTSPAQPKNKLIGQTEPVKDFDLFSELESYAEVNNREPEVSNMDAQKEMGNEDSLPEQLADENACIRSRSVESYVEVNNKETEVSNTDAQKEVGNEDSLPEQFEDENACTRSRSVESYVEVNNRETEVSNTDAQKEMGNEDSLPEQFVDENACIRGRSVERRLNEESENVGETMNIDENNSNPSVLDNAARVDMSSRKETDAEQQPEVRKSKLPKKQKVAAGEKRIRKAHPMRKSLAESGTSFESGVRRSKRIKMRPLEYWKGERFLYGRVNDSLKLIGVKYISPGKDTGKLKVKPYIPSDSSEYKELLELAALH